MHNFIKGTLGSFVIHLLFGLLAFALVYFYTSDFNHASEALLDQLKDVDEPEAEAMVYLAAARDQLVGWIWPVMTASFLCSLLFLGLAERTMPSTPAQRQSKMGLWTVLLIVLFFFASGWWWFAVASPEADFAMQFGNYVTTLIATGLLALLGYYLATAMFVKTTMVPSVPFAPVLRGK